MLKVPACTGVYHGPPPILQRVRTVYYVCVLRYAIANPIRQVGRIKFLVRPSIASPTFLLYFQVNTVVGRFWIMLKISTWLVGRLLRFFKKKPLLPFVPLFTICITSPKTVYAIYSIYLIATL